MSSPSSVRLSLSSGSRATVPVGLLGIVQAIGRPAVVIDHVPDRLKG
jgi:hypothetical protein